MRRGEHGWFFCQYVTDTCHFNKPEAVQFAEHWPVDNSIVLPTDANGAGFDATQNDGPREALGTAIGQPAGGAAAFMDIGRIATELVSLGVHEHWRAVQCVENHDILYRDRGARIPQITDSSSSRSWYVRSRSRVALGLTLTALGSPHIFMGQEFLEDKQWHDEPSSSFQIWGGGRQAHGRLLTFIAGAYECETSVCRSLWSRPERFSC